VTTWYAIFAFALVSLAVYVAIYVRKQRQGWPKDDKQLYQRVVAGLAFWTVLTALRLVFHVYK
jgi:hypothetical protein